MQRPESNADRAKAKAAAQKKYGASESRERAAPPLDAESQAAVDRTVADCNQKISIA